jgi:hypothetical protein
MWQVSAEFGVHSLMQLLYVVCKFIVVAFPSVALIAVVFRVVQNSALREKIKFFKGRSLAEIGDFKISFSFPLLCRREDKH